MLATPTINPTNTTPNDPNPFPPPHPAIYALNHTPTVTDEFAARVQRIALKSLDVLEEFLDNRHSGEDHKPSRAIRIALYSISLHERLQRKQNAKGAGGAARRPRTHRRSAETYEPTDEPWVPLRPDDPEPKVYTALPLDAREKAIVMAYFPHILELDTFDLRHMADYWRHQVRTQRYWRAYYHPANREARARGELTTPPRGEINLRLGTRDDPVFPDTRPGSRPDIHPSDPPSSA